MTITPQPAAKKQEQSLKKIVDFFSRLRRRISRRILLLEFMPEALLISEASLQASQIALNNCRLNELPDGATDRGTPLDPDAMAELISEICSAEKFHSLRTAVVLPPEAVHVSSHWLPAGLDADQLKKYVLEPGSPVQLPFPLDQTDFELIPHHVAALEASDDLQYYCLIAVSKRLIDRLIETIKISGQELLFVGSSVMGLMRLARFALINLSDKEVILIIELLADYSHITVASASAPICCDRLTAIREFPAFPKNVDSDDRAEAANVVKAGLPEDYLPLSDLDIRALASDVKEFISNFEIKNIVSLRVVKVLLSGPSSAHPGIDELFAEALAMPVQRLRIRNDPQLASAELPDGLHAAAISRLVGLGLKFLPSPVCSDDWNLTMQPTKVIEMQVKPSSQEFQPNLLIEPLELSSDLKVDPIEEHISEPLFSFGYKEESEEYGEILDEKIKSLQSKYEDLNHETEESFSLGLGEPELDDPSQWPSIKS
jgi:Tfp pilus assembly PilM family ATPase